MVAMRVQGWDPVLIISQIICMQTIHYLTLALLVPPLLSSLTSPSLLSYSGGSSTVAHIMDWREMAARPTVSTSSFPGLEGAAAAAQSWRKLRGAWAGGKQVGAVEATAGGVGSGMRPGETELDVDWASWDYGVDDVRGWLLGVAWIAASAVDIIPLYYLIRRPTHILDFALTLNFNHLILTTYYAKAFPTSFFFWIVQSVGALVMIVFGEQLCVKREMSTDLDIGWSPNAEGEVIELNDR